MTNQSGIPKIFSLFIKPSFYFNTTSFRRQKVRANYNKNTKNRLYLKKYCNFAELMIEDTDAVFLNNENCAEIPDATK